MKNFNELSEREVPALAISLEEEDERVYADFSEGLHHGLCHVVWCHSGWNEPYFSSHCAGFLEADEAAS